MKPAPVKLGEQQTPVAAPPRLDLDEMWVEALESKASAVEAGDVADQDLGRLAEFTRRVVLAAESPAAVGRSLGWGPHKVRRLLHTRVYAEMRAVVLAEHGQTLDQKYGELSELVHETAYIGALRQQQIVTESPDDALVNKIAESSLDRIGLRAPEKKQTKVTVELSPETVALFEKAKADRAVVKAIDLERDFAFATKRPALDDERAKEKIGTGYLPAPEAK